MIPFLLLPWLLLLAGMAGGSKKTPEDENNDKASALLVVPRPPPTSPRDRYLSLQSNTMGDVPLRPTYASVASSSSPSSPPPAGAAWLSAHPPAVMRPAATFERVFIGSSRSSSPDTIPTPVPASYSPDEDKDFIKDLEVFLAGLWQPPPDYEIIKRQSTDRPLAQAPALQSYPVQCDEMGFAFETVHMLPRQEDAEMEELYFRLRHGTNRNTLRMVENIGVGEGADEEDDSTDEFELIGRKGGKSEKNKYVRKTFGDMTTFMRELQLSILLRDSRLPQFTCWETFSGFPSMIFRNIQGVDSGRYFYNIGYSLGSAGYVSITQKVVSMVTQVLGAIVRLHSLGYVHGDIKDKNILVDEQDMAHLIDLDMARLVSLSHRSGTEGYRAPEMLGAVKGEIGKAADFWSFGVVVLRWFGHAVAGSIARGRDDSVRRSARHQYLIRIGYTAATVGIPQPVLDKAEDYAEEQARNDSDTKQIVRQYTSYMPFVTDQTSGKINVKKPPFQVSAPIGELLYHLLTADPTDRCYDTSEKLAQLYSVKLLESVNFETVEESCFLPPHSAFQIDHLRSHPIAVHRPKSAMAALDLNTERVADEVRMKRLSGPKDRLAARLVDPYNRDVNPIFLPHKPGRAAHDGKLSTDPEWLWRYGRNTRIFNRFPQIFARKQEEERSSASSNDKKSPAMPIPARSLSPSKSTSSKSSRATPQSPTSSTTTTINSPRQHSSDDDFDRLYFGSRLPLEQDADFEDGSSGNPGNAHR